MKYEWRKQEKNLYGVKQTPVIVEVPKQKFILVKGKGNPNEVDFSDRISAKALENIKKKKPDALYDEISFRKIEEGKSIQILHVGS